MGLQHAFAMIGGLITPPLVIFRFTVCGFPFCPPLEQYAISAALITSGICTLINLSKLPIPYSEKIFGHVIYVGSGVLSVMVSIILYIICCNPSGTLTAFAIRFYLQGTSFTFLPVFEISIAQMKADGIDGEVAYGKMLGTSMVCCLLELGFSLMPVKYVRSTLLYILYL
jgi:xanthine/uracil permease